MRVAPDARQSAEERTVLVRMTRSALARAGLAVTPAEAAHPAVVEIAHLAQRGVHVGTADPERIGRLGRMLDWARAGITGPPPPAATRPVEPAAPAPHLERSVARARNSLPARDDGAGKPRESALVAWREHDRERLRETIALLTAAWPEAWAELEEVLFQVALLDGSAIDGFTDFGVHGAVFIHRDRLGPGPGALPGTVRLAEALVHEGAHTRCNAASVAAAPFLRPAQGEAQLVATPLRIDPRPLTGLFQQVVVLARSVMLYERVLDSGTEASASAAVRLRRDELAADALAGVRTLMDHRDALTDHGVSVLEDAARVAGIRA
ncbi:aKG-HExxH-type peptide beta-hydroxylase [Streptomyces roseochromogenus]|uniref:aKG-HExxH-type peptide beta-hydroxylase n=1 Tax=Streptomyces roseochromogenus TaxID=285450 RepID=UPI000B127C22|nr:HEXXH motif-containing putative peptide modification protein [Streptomyces roseochromogenus]